MLYFGWIAYTIFTDDDFGSGGVGPLMSPPEGLADVAVIPVLGLVLGWWVAGDFRRAIAFKPAEAHLLVPAPVSRRTLIRFKLASTQPGVILTAFGFTAWAWLMSGGSLPMAHVVRLTVASWIVVWTMHLHQIGASLVRTSAAERGRVGLRHHWLPIAMLLVMLTVVAAAVGPLFPALRGAATFGRAISIAADAMRDPWVAGATLPVRFTLAPLFASEAGAWLAALPGALGVLVLHYLWVLRSDAAFEEGAAEAGRVQAERRNAMAQGGGMTALLEAGKRLPRPWFRLRPRGHPAVAVVWKNLTLAARMLKPSSALLMVGVFLASYVVLRLATGAPREAAGITAGMAFMIVVVLALMGSLTMRTDLRADMARIDIVKTLPLSGRDLVAAEVASAALALTVLQLLFTGIGLVFLLVGFPDIDPWWLPAACAGSAIVVLPPVNAVLIAAQNGLAILFPGWVRVGVEHAEGVEQMGYFMLVFIANALLFVLALLGPLVFAAGVGFRLQIAMGAWAAIPASLGGWLVLWGEVALLVVLLGEAFDELDPAEAGLLT